MLPLLSVVGRVPLKLATGTTLVQVTIAAAIGMLSHYQGGMVDLKAGLILGMAGIAGGFVGSLLSVPLSIRFLESIFLFVVALAIILLFIPLELEDKNYRKGNFNKAFGIAIGFGVGVLAGLLGVGVLAGLLGVGGGFIIIPLMTYFLKIPLRVTIGTSLLIILISSFGTLGAKFKIGHVNLLITFLVISGSVIGAFLGAYVSRRTQVKSLRLVLLSILVLIFITVGYKTFF